MSSNPAGRVPPAPNQLGINTEQSYAMKMVSWNVNGIRASAEKGFLAFLEREDPDILCIQESKAHIADVEKHLIRPLGRFSYWSSADRKGYSGTVTFVRKPAKAMRDGIGIKKFDHEGRFVVTDHGDFILFNVYFPNGSNTPARHWFKQEFLHRFSSYLKRLKQSQKNIIVVGDYNTAYMEEDVFDPKLLSKASGFLPEERAWFKDFLNLGFVDSFRHFHPQKKDTYTWWSYRENARKHNRGWRIDHICVTSALTPYLKSADIMSSQYGSDHCPVVLQLSL